MTTCWLPSMWVAVRRDPELQRFYRRKLVQKGLRKARVAVARKLGIRLWVMLRDEIDYHRILLILNSDGVLANDSCRPYGRNGRTAVAKVH